MSTSLGERGRRGRDLSGVTSATAARGGRGLRRGERALGVLPGPRPLPGAHLRGPGPHGCRARLRSGPPEPLGAQGGSARRRVSRLQRHRPPGGHGARPQERGKQLPALRGALGTRPDDLAPPRLRRRLRRRPFGGNDLSRRHRPRPRHHHRRHPRKRRHRLGRHEALLLRHRRRRKAVPPSPPSSPPRRRRLVLRRRRLQHSRHPPTPVAP
mmetsp:Transcript_8738/g.28579  ORF Transcript_8738/g.28579 Transcript_8738/m.28579 type:complete len:212 (-) Transcript_8738:106-741(-)